MHSGGSVSHADDWERQCRGPFEDLDSLGAGPLELNGLGHVTQARSVKLVHEHVVRAGKDHRSVVLVGGDLLQGHDQASYAPH